MSLTVSIDPSLTALLRALGVLDADEQVDASWFQDPIGAVGRILSNPAQRAGLLDLLDETLPPDAAASPPGGSWHPLLDPAGRGNVYVTVEGDVIGVAGELATPVGAGARVSGGLRIPLVDVAGSLTAIAGTADGPLELTLDVELDPGGAIGAVRIAATVDADRGAAIVVTLEDVDVGAGPETLEITSAELGRDLVRAVETLVREALESVTGADDRLARVVDHLLGAVGLDGELPPLPLEALAEDPGAVREWLVALAGDETDLRAWFAHLAGLLGADPPSTAEPLGATLLELSGGVRLDLTVEVRGGELWFSLALAVPGDRGSLEASAVMLVVPLGGAPLRIVPEASVSVRAPAGPGPLVDEEPTVRVGSLAGGLRFDGTELTPQLMLVDVTLDGVTYPTLDLTSATAVIDVATDALRQAIEDALGTTDPARALLALLGILPPRGDPGTPHAIDIVAFAQAPTRALAELHRVVLADPAHGWNHMFAELGALLGLAGAVSGGGTAANPWRIEIARSGPALRLDLVAWDALVPTTPPGERRLRIGLQASATSTPWSSTLRMELLGFDLPPDEAAAVRLIGEQKISVALEPVPEVGSPSGITVAADVVRADATWSPGAPLVATARIEDVRVTAGDLEAGPLTFVFPPADPSGPDLGLGAAIDELVELLRLLARHALLSFGGEGMASLGDLLGISGEADWPLLELPDPADLGSIAARPADALRTQLQRILTEVGERGDPYAERAVRTVAGLVRDQAPRPEDGFTPRLDVSITGAGTYESPWALPLATLDDERVDLLVWLDPDGPPESWAQAITARLVGASDATTLAGLAGELAGFVPGLPDWPDELLHGDALARLASWLAGGDGLAPLSSQLPDLPNWSHGAALAVPNARQPSDPAAIAQIAAQLDSWADEDGGRAVLLFGPAWSDRTVWGTLLAAVEPGRPVDAHFDLRGGTNPQDVTAIAGHYTADLDDDDSGDVAGLAAQLGVLVDRVIALTGRTRVVLVGHGPAGITARVLAAARREAVRGIVTLGTPHGGEPPAPLTDPALAEAVRLARSLGDGVLAGTPVAEALDQLDAALDGLPGAPVPTAFAAVPDGTANPVPGLAIGSALGGNLVSLLADTLSARVGAAAADPNRAAPTHAGYGLRLGLPFPDPAPPEPGDTRPGLAVDAHVRLDAGRIALDAAAPEPARPARAAHVSVYLRRPGGWFVGQPIGPGPRVRSAELEVSIVPAAHGTVAATAQLTLRDVVLGAARTDLVLGDAGLAPALDLLVDAFGAAAAGTLEAAVLDLARAAGALVGDGAGGLQADPAGLNALATAPTSTLLARRDALLDALAAAMGGELELPLTSVPLTASYNRATHTVRVRTVPEIVLSDGLAATLDGRLDLRTLAPTLDAGLHSGLVALTHDSATGRLTLSAPPWLDPLVVRPAPPPEAMRAALAPFVPRLALSSALSTVLGGLLTEAATIGPLDALLDDPGAALAGWDGATVQPLIQNAARVLGVDDSNGIALPGGFELSASGTGALRLELTGTLDLGAAGDELTIGLTLVVDAARTVSPGGTLAFDVGVPGSFGRVAVEFAVEATGVGLVVTPANGTPIRLLPQFGGFGDLLVSGARALLPHLLQAIVDELRPASGPPTGLLGAALALATALGIYADDAEGFEAPDRVEALVAMLEPGWLESRSDATALAALIAGLFGPPPLLRLPLGTVTRTGDRLVWTAPAAGASISVELRLGAAGSPELALAADGLDAGPLTVQSSRFGWDGTVTFELHLRLDPGGELAYLTPELDLGLAGTALTAELQPLGADRQGEVSFTFAPTPAVAFTADGALALVTEWGVPLVGDLLLAELEDDLDRALWTGGPSAREVLEASGLVAPGSDPARIVAEIPPLSSMLLGAVQALADGVTLQVTPALAVSVVNEGGRSGLRLKGSHEAAGDELTVSVSFGEADWLDDADAGVTLWLLRTDSALDPPIALDPGLDAIGIGGMLLRSGGAPLVNGPVVIGSAGGLLFASFDFLDASGRPTVDVSGLGAAVELEDAQIAIASSDGDSFIQELLPPELQGPFSLAVEQRDGQDLRLHGGIGGEPGQIELTFPLDLDLTVVRIDELYLLISREGDTTTALAALSGGATLEPIDVVVERVGLRATIDDTGVALAFKPPDGLGIAITTDGLRAGGYLLVDELHGRYVGAIEITVVDSFSIVAIGIVTTELPDGSPGFSLLFLVSITFPAPIPIGFGFFFAGAGGLLGLNRAVDLDRLTLGLRTGTADSILFPTDVVNRIDTIVRDLEETFPIDEGHFLVAPMAMITWSTPALITAKVGLILEIGEPFTLAIVGTLRLALPSPDPAVVDLNVAFLGAIDIGASLLRFDASIYDSYIGYGDVRISIEGDIALRVAWGDLPDFVTSVGGFHPGYTPASHLQLPPMRRLSVSLLKGNPRLTLSAYFAATTNTAQFGAMAELYVSAGGFSIEGVLGFDLLVQFVPFYLNAHVYARLAVKKGSTELLSVSLDFTLEGPTPWIASGKAKFKVLFVSVTVAFTVRLGQEVPTSLPSVAVLPQVLDALAADDAWTAELGESASELVMLVPPAAGDLVIDAAGLLTVSQKVVPLATDFTLVGVAQPSDVTRVSVQELRLGATARAAETSDVTDAFAPIAFQALSDADKLTAPAFEQRPAGVLSSSGETLTADTVLGHPVAYEQVVFDSAADPEPVRSVQSPAASLFEALVPGGAIGASTLSKARARQGEKSSVLAVEPVTDRFAVTRLRRLEPLAANGSTAAPIAVDELGRPVYAPGIVVSRTDAEQRRNELLASRGQDGLQILPEAQLVG